MNRLTILLAAGAAGLAVGVPAAAQAQYQSPYAYPPQAYPQGQYYPQQGYGYPGQPQGGISQIIGQLLGNRYQANDRTAVERCATAAMAQASAQYRPGRYGNQGYGNQGYYPAQMRVTAITEVQRQRNGVRVSGLLDSQSGYQPPYGQAYGYQGQRYAGQADLSFRCNVDYRGAVSNVRIRRGQTAYNRGY